MSATGILFITDALQQNVYIVRYNKKSNQLADNDYKNIIERIKREIIDCDRRIKSKIRKGSS